MIAPTFALNFTTATLNPRVTFSRPLATATRFNASGFIETVVADTPRFEFNPNTLVCRGLLIEQSSENLIFGNTTATNLTTATTTDFVNLNGAASPTVQIPTAVAAAHGRRYNGPTHTIGVTYTRSIYIRSVGYTKALISDGNGGRVAAAFDLPTLSVTFTDGVDFVSAEVELVKDGWYRCSVTYTASASTIWFSFTTYPEGATINRFGATFTGDGTSGFVFFGAQQEIGSKATSQIPTTSAAVTRNADVATITGTNFSDFWQAARGGASVLATPSTVSGIRPLIQFDDGTVDNIIALRGNTTNPELYIVDGGTPQAQIDAGAIAANTAYSLTGWWATNDCKARKDSGTVVTDTTATIPTVTQMRIGSDGTNYLNGTIATINYYDSFFGRPIYTRRKNKVFASLL